MSRSFSLPTELVTYLAEHNPVEHPALTACRNRTAGHERVSMQISQEQGAFLAFLIRLIDARLAVEIGVFTGYSSLVTALALRQNAGPGAKLFALDLNESFIKEAQTTWAEAGVQKSIDVRIGPASQSLDRLGEEGFGGRIDFIFVDADKTGYLDYYEKGLALLRTGGLMVFDNVLWSGAVADLADLSDDTVALREVATFAQSDPRVHATMVAIGDGLLLVRKL